MIDGTLGFAAGALMAASYWSLLATALEMSARGDVPAWIPAAIGFLIGAFSCASSIGSSARIYTQSCNLTAGKDHRTYDLSLSILLQEEIEHESWFSEFLDEGPSGHFMRKGETSPFVSKYLR